MAKRNRAMKLEVIFTDKGKDDMNEVLDKIQSEFKPKRMFFYEVDYIE